jgi:hypothetical protein
MRRTICLDFDGVLHSYSSGWKGAEVVADGPVPGAQDFVRDLFAAGFSVAVFSARSHQTGGIEAIVKWWALHKFPLPDDISGVLLTFPESKPPALLYVDDRGFRFEGDFGAVAEMASTAMLPWNKKGSI